MRRIKVLVVEDSLVFREILAQILGTDPEIEVVATAEDPYEARDAIVKYAPDVMTLDIELPKMNGIEFLKKLMPQYPMPVVVISSLADKVLDALSAGAVDFVSKPGTSDRKELEEFVRKDLTEKVKIASHARVGTIKRELERRRMIELETPRPGRIVTPPIGTVKRKDTVIAIGASTGGTEAILAVVREFKPDIPGVVIVQHMPPGFTEVYSRRLNTKCEVDVKEARDGDKVLPGHVLIAPGDKHMRLVKKNGSYQVSCESGPKVGGHCPAVNVLFDSVAEAAGPGAIGILLTGMGADGADGLLRMRRAGAQTIGQDEESCIVYGMPKVAYETGAVQYQVGLTGIASKVYDILGKR